MCTSELPVDISSWYLLLLLVTVISSLSIPRDEEALYVRFSKEVTDEVLDRGIYTDRALRQVFQAHIARNRGKLDEVCIQTGHLDRCSKHTLPGIEENWTRCGNHLLLLALLSRRRL